MNPRELPLIVKFMIFLLFWTTVGFVLSGLLAKLDLLDPAMGQVFYACSAVSFILSVIVGAVVYQKSCMKIYSDIQGWDDETKNNVFSFLKIRKRRLVMMSLFATLLFLLNAIPGLIQKQKELSEVFPYLFVICLFHSALVSTLIFAKIFRASTWTQYENQVALLEES